MQTSNTTPSPRIWRILRRCLVGIAIFVTIVALFYAEEDIRGRMTWAATQRECAAKGIDLNPHSFEPPRVPDDENFAATPFLAPLFDFNPKPLKPGQSPWRDPGAYQKAMDFGQDFLKAYNSVRSQLENPAHPMADLATLATAIHKRAKTPVPEFSIRSDAAADLLRSFEEYTPVLDELRTASKRPYSRFNIGYDDPNPALILLSHLAVLKRIAWIASYRASAELALGRNDAAFNDLQLALTMADSLHNEPFMISHLVRIAILKIAQSAIWEGLATHAWSDKQLEELQTRLSKMTVLADETLSMRWELASHGTILFDLMRHNPKEVFDATDTKAPIWPLRIIPSGWLYLEQASFVRIYSDAITAGYDPKTGVANPRNVEAAEAHLAALFPGKVSLLWHHRFVAVMLVPSVTTFHRKSARSQTEVNETVVACALERYRMANGQFPGDLDSLSPRYLAAIPHDVTNGGPLKYRLTGPNQFLLTSAGWDETEKKGYIGIVGSHPHNFIPTNWGWEPYPQN